MKSEKHSWVISSVLLIITLLWGSTVWSQHDAQVRRRPFVRGDSNGDGVLSLGDIVTTIRFFRIPDASPPCADAADFDDSGVIDPTDIVGLLTFVFFGSGRPAQPYPDPGADLTPDAYGCDSGSPTVFKGVEGEREREDGQLDKGPFGCNGLLGQEIDFIHFANEVVYGYPGQRDLRAPVLLRNKQELDGLTLSFYSPPDRARLRGIAFGETLQDFRPELVWPNALRLEEGFFALMVIMDHSTPFNSKRYPKSCDDRLGDLVFSIQPDAEPGDQFTLGLEDQATLVNEFSVLGGVSVLPILGRELRVEVHPYERFFIRGDSNRDGDVDLADAVLTLRYLFQSQTVDCLDPLDVDDNGGVTITDVVALLRHLFADGRAPASPFPRMGMDLSSDELGDCG